MFALKMVFGSSCIDPRWRFGIGLGVCLCGIGLNGCGGQSGASSGSGTASVGQTATVGSLSITSVGQAKPLITTSTANVSTFAQAGAAYSSIVCNPTKSLSDTFLILRRDKNTYGEISRIYYLGGPETPIVPTATQGDFFFPSCSQNGLICIWNIFTRNVDGINPDGSGFKNILGTTPAQTSCISPNGATVAVFSGTAMDIVPFGGGTQTPVGINVSWSGAFAPVFNPTGTMIAGVGTNSNTGGYSHVFTTATTANSAAVDVTPSGYASGNWSSIAWSSDGQTLVGTFTASGSSTSDIVEFNPTTGIRLELTASGNSESSPAFSPDGLHVAFYRSSAGGATAGIYEEDNYGNSTQLIELDTTGNVVEGLCWSDFLPTKTFIGGGGALGGSAAGFISSQAGTRFASLATFNATTPSTATVTAPSSTSGYGPLLYTLSANLITTISYTNVYIGQVTSFGVSEPTAIVSVDGQTGLIDNVVAAAIPAKTTYSGSTAVLDGKFTAIYDATGKNRAPNGASHVEIDKQGRLLTFR